MDRFQENSELLKAMAHPIRLRIVSGLTTGRECNVGRMVEKLGLPQSTVSQHLGVLKRQGIITARRDGVRVCYSVNSARVLALIEALAVAHE